jgi:hypothetical protein
VKYSYFWEVYMRAYHVEGNDIFEGNFAGFVFLNKDLVDQDRAGTGGETENEGV